MYWQEKMIISKIIGGLGNQLFQYAAGRTLAHLNQSEFRLDVSAFDEYKLRDFELLNFNIAANFATENEIKGLLPAHNLEKIFQYLSPVRKRTYYREKYFHFDKNVLMLGPDVYLKGHFQSEKYFLSAVEIIRKEITLKDAVIRNVADFSKKSRSGNSISVHIRRGDLSKNSVSTEYHGILSAEYYKDAFEVINSKIPNPVFYFFSDDINWVKENLNIPGAIYVSGEISKNHLEDLYLMSQCKHHIIANSSFSWWGAWLNDNPEKIVIAPKKWFNKGPKDTYDLYPEGWIVI
jgi:hypothetical protein